MLDIFAGRCPTTRLPVTDTEYGEIDRAVDTVLKKMRQIGKIVVARMLDDKYCAFTQHF